MQETKIPDAKIPILSGEDIEKGTDKSKGTDLLEPD